MTLKILSIYPDATIAMEGFIEDVVKYLTGNMYGLLNEKTANRIVNEAFHGNDYSMILKRVSAIIDQVVLNPKWIAKSVSKKVTQIESEHTWIDGKVVTDPIKLLHCMGEMLKGAKEALAKAEDNTKLRLELIGKIKNMHKAEDADALYEQHKAALAINPANLYKKRGGKAYSCISDQVDIWPVVNTPKGSYYSSAIGSNKNNKLDLATEKTAALYGKAVIDLIHIATEAKDLFQKNRIPYWEFCPLEYDELRYGDEIFDQIYSAQDSYQATPMFTLYGDAMTFAKTLLKSILIK